MDLKRYLESVNRTTWFYRIINNLTSLWFATTANYFGEDFSTGDYLEKRTVRWKIDNFDDIRRSEELICSQSISINLGERYGFPTEWICYLQPRDEESSIQSDIKQVGIFLRLKRAPSGVKEIICSLKVTISKTGYCDPNGPLATTKNFLKLSKPLLTGWGWNCFITPEMPSKTILLHGSLVVELDLKIYSTDLMHPRVRADTLYSVYKPEFCDKLQADLEKMLTDHFDGSAVGAKIISSDGLEFPVNRGILAARSPVFERMFQSDMEESRTGIINITDLSSETVKVLLHFLYTGTLTDGWNAAGVIPEFLYAAGKYQLPDLLGFFDEVAGAVCRKENVGRLLGHAKKLGLKQAETSMMAFMRKHLLSTDDLFSFAEDCSSSNFVGDANINVS